MNSFKKITTLFSVLSVVCGSVQTALCQESDTLARYSNNTITRKPDKIAEYPGGIPELMKFLNAEITYPQEALDNGIRGMVVVEFVVCSDGTVCDVRTVRSVHESLDKEAIRVVELMKKWTPGQSDGMNVSSYFQLPVTFHIQTKEEQKQARKQKRNKNFQKNIKTLGN
ncbi:MAG: TonB family protein [Bacteroidetes bacterium]|nr:TonB family protein [Bacteroidota bacterium]